MSLKMGKVGEDTYVTAKYDYTAQGRQELDIKKNERLLLLDDSKHWWKVQNNKNQAGYVPSNYVKREKPSIFDSIKRRVKKKSDFKVVSVSAPASPSPKEPDINVNVSTGTLPDGRTENFLNTSAVVKYNYEAQQTDEISLVKGTKVLVMEKSNDGWWRGEYNGKIGWFPSNYVQEESEEHLVVGGPGDFHTYAPADSADHPDRTENSLESVVALYSFTSQNNEELNFQKGERLEIVEKPVNDPEWWRARNCHGEVGLVPKNYVQLVGSDDEECAYPKLQNGPTTNNSNITNNSKMDAVVTALAEKQLGNLSLGGATGGLAGSSGNSTPRPDLGGKAWYFGNITRNQCDRMLNEFAIDGDFLIRDSETNLGDYSVSLKAPGRNKHFRVHVEDNIFCIGQRRFNTLDELVEHYKRAPIYTSPKGDKLYLIKPFHRPQNSNY